MCLGLSFSSFPFFPFLPFLSSLSFHSFPSFPSFPFLSFLSFLSFPSLDPDGIRIVLGPNGLRLVSGPNMKKSLCNKKVVKSRWYLCCWKGRYTFIRVTLNTKLYISIIHSPFPPSLLPLSPPSIAREETIVKLGGEGCFDHLKICCVRLLSWSVPQQREIIWNISRRRRDIRSHAKLQGSPEKKKHPPSPFPFRGFFFRGYPVEEENPHFKVLVEIK